ncbi:MAG: hypothetical protein H7X88_09810 [Gloeobacteraceae cyanobacterium ES-bin-316]|nr:hypothetical protein [Ferruginibacter sp.]
MKKLKVHFAALLGCFTLLAVVQTSCNDGEKKVETVTETSTTDTMMTPVIDTMKMDSAAPMPVKTTN